MLVRLHPFIYSSFGKKTLSNLTHLAEYFCEINGSLAILKLNRTKALNSLTLGLIRSIKDRLLAWENDPSVKVILIKGMGEKAFCSGGDIVSIIKSAREGGYIHHAFFVEEYKLNHLTSLLKTPYISLYNGITMGGGVGISVHGKYRVATNVTTFAMPETAIGFHPDVGGSFFLPQLRDSLGMFLALTGFRLKGQEIVQAGIATHFINTDDVSIFENDLSNVLEIKEVKPLLDNLNQIRTDEIFEFEIHKEMIDFAFTADTIEEIITRLSLLNTKWGDNIVAVLLRMSPTSLKVTHRSLRLGGKLSLMNCLRMECNISNHFLKTSDFYEGVRALLLDKDYQPKWDPISLDLVTPEIIDSYFRESGGNAISFFNSSDLK